MKKFRKLIPAFVLLLISTAIMSTATFAWFSMNTTVAATNMSVTAKSDQIFLMIEKGTHTAAEVRSAGLISDEATTASSALLPVAHNLNSSSNYTAYDAVSSSAMTNWYWMTSDNPASYVGSSGPLAVDEAKFGQYVLVNTFTIAIAEGSNNVANLRVETCTITADNAEAVKVVVAGENGSDEFDGAGGAGHGVNLRTANITSSDAVTVKIYVYWDGNDSDVYTNNIAKLENTSVVVTFTGDVVE